MGQSLVCAAKENEPKNSTVVSVNDVCSFECNASPLKTFFS